MTNETDIQELRGAEWMRANPLCQRCGHRHPDAGTCATPGPLASCGCRGSGWRCRAAAYAALEAAIAKATIIDLTGTA